MNDKDLRDNEVRYQSDDVSIHLQLHFPLGRKVFLVAVGDIEEKVANETYLYVGCSLVSYQWIYSEIQEDTFYPKVQAK